MIGKMGEDEILEDYEYFIRDEDLGIEKKRTKTNNKKKGHKKRFHR